MKPSLHVALLVTLGCGEKTEDMHQVSNLTSFEDNSGSACEAEPVAAFGWEDGHAEVSAIAIDGDTLYAFVRSYVDQTSYLQVLDISEPGHIALTGRVDLPQIPWIESAELHEGVLYGSFQQRGTRVVSVDIGSPTAPVLLGEDTDDSLFSGDLAYGDQVLSSRRFPPEACAIEVYEDGALDQELVTDSCLSAGLSQNAAGVAAIGFDGDGEPRLAQLALADGAWELVKEVSLAHAKMEQLDKIRGYRHGALVIGGNGFRHGVAAWDGTDEVFTWFTGQAFVEDMALSEHHAWVTLQRESGAFAGVLALDFSACIPENPGIVLEVSR